MNINQEKLLTIIRAPHVTEKSSSGERQVAFKVAVKATKLEIKRAVEHVFKVKVASVRVCNFKGKKTRFSQRLGRHRHWKKAYITLFPGQELELLQSKA